MESELKEVGLTFTLGGLAFFGFWQVFQMIGLVPQEWPKPRDSTLNVHAVAVIAMIFGAGFILEDFSKHISAEREPERNTIYSNCVDTDKICG
jgi:hypothetical protein